MLPITRPNNRRIALHFAGYFFCFVILSCHVAAAETKTDSERLEKLERAVELLQKRNTELEAEVKSLKQQKSAPAAPLTARSDKAGIKSRLERHTHRPRSALRRALHVNRAADATPR